MKIINRWLEKFIAVLDLQLALTAISLPFIIGWGLPISLIAVVGNLIFGPFLTVFLLLASLLFTTQLLHIPNGLLVTLLEWCNALWGKVLSFTTSHVLMSVPTVPPYMLALMFVIACFILCFRMSKPMRLALYCAFLIGVLGILKLYAYTKHDCFTVKQGSKCLTFVKSSHELICIDHGVNVSRGLKSWFFYTVLPELRKRVGTTNITTYIVLRPCKGTVELCRLFDVGHGVQLIMPDALSHTNNDDLAHAQVLEYVREHGLTMQTVFAQRPIMIMSGGCQIMLTALEISYATHNALYCCAECNDGLHPRVFIPRLTRREREQLQLQPMQAAGTSNNNRRL